MSKYPHLTDGILEHGFHSIESYVEAGRKYKPSKSPFWLLESSDAYSGKVLYDMKAQFCFLKTCRRMQHSFLYGPNWILNCIHNPGDVIFTKGRSAEQRGSLCHISHSGAPGIYSTWQERSNLFCKHQVINAHNILAGEMNG